jgi:hypothetical protein
MSHTVYTPAEKRAITEAFRPPTDLIQYLATSMLFAHQTGTQSTQIDTSKLFEASQTLASYGLTLGLLTQLAEKADGTDAQPIADIIYATLAVGVATTKEARKAAEES